jgi:hypothetical protein
MKKRIRDKKRTAPAAAPAASPEWLALRAGIGRLSRGPVKPHPLALSEQPFDRQLLARSRLFARSRELYLDGGGEFHATLVSSPRTLGSEILVTQTIEYSPIERELLWAATDPVERRNAAHLLQLRTFSSSLYHEQSHRILWKLLPPPPSSRDGMRRYLNFAESLVIAADMALGDELGPKLARTFYLTGVTYDPGTELRGLRLSRRVYRNYLHAAAYATYLELELYSDEGIARAVRSLYPLSGNLAERAVRRAGNLDRAFVAITNPEWQKRHWQRVSRRLRHGRAGEAALELAENPGDNRLQYLWAERWFELMGV